MSRSQWEVKGILTHVVHCTQYSDLCRDCSMTHWNSPGTLTQSQDNSETDLLKLIWWSCNSFLQLQFSCSEEQSAALICSFSCQHPCLTAGLCTQNILLCLEAPPNSTTVPYTGYFKQEKSSLFFIFFPSYWSLRNSSHCIKDIYNDLFTCSAGQKKTWQQM